MNSTLTSKASRARLLSSGVRFLPWKRPSPGSTFLQLTKNEGENCCKNVDLLGEQKPPRGINRHCHGGFIPRKEGRAKSQQKIQHCGKYLRELCRGIHKPVYKPHVYHLWMRLDRILHEESSGFQAHHIVFLRVEGNPVVEDGELGECADHLPGARGEEAAHYSPSWGCPRPQHLVGRVDCTNYIAHDVRPQTLTFRSCQVVSLKPSLIFVLLAKLHLLGEEEQLSLHLWRNSQVEEVPRCGRGEKGGDEVVWPQQKLLPQFIYDRQPGIKIKMTNIEPRTDFHLATCCSALTSSLPIT